MSKTIVCRCEDVTLADVEHTLAIGYHDIEEIKRYTGFGTGPCQGKECLAVVADVLLRSGKCKRVDIAPFTTRAPLEPAPLKLFGRGGGARKKP